jgi:hypothetical protein
VTSRTSQLQRMNTYLGIYLAANHDHSVSAGSKVSLRLAWLMQLKVDMGL